MSDSRPAFAYGLNWVPEQDSNQGLPPGAVGAVRLLDGSVAYVWGKPETGRSENPSLLQSSARGDTIRVEEASISHELMTSSVVKGLFTLATSRRKDRSLRFVTAELEVMGRPDLVLWVKVDPNFRNGRPGDWRMVLAGALKDSRNREAWRANGKTGAEKPVTMEAWAGPRIKVLLKKK